MTIKFDEPDRQLMILALAHLAVEQPGLEAALTQIAQRCGGGDHGIKMFNDFKFTRTDDIAIANEALWLNPKNKRGAKPRTRPYKSN